MEEKMTVPKNTLQKMLYIFSPCVLAAGFCIIAMIQANMQMESSGGWSYIAILLLKPVLVCSLIAGILTKILLRNRIGLLWIIEIAILVILYFLFLFYAFT